MPRAGRSRTPCASLRALLGDSTSHRIRIVDPGALGFERDWSRSANVWNGSAEQGDDDMTEPPRGEAARDDLAKLDRASVSRRVLRERGDQRLPTLLGPTVIGRVVLALYQPAKRFLRRVAIEGEAHHEGERPPAGRIPGLVILDPALEVLHERRGEVLAEDLTLGAGSGRWAPGSLRAGDYVGGGGYSEGRGDSRDERFERNTRRIHKGAKIVGPSPVRVPFEIGAEQPRPSRARLAAPTSVVQREDLGLRSHVGREKRADPRPGCVEIGGVFRPIQHEYEVRSLRGREGEGIQADSPQRFDRATKPVRDVRTDQRRESSPRAGLPQVVEPHRNDLAVFVSSLLDRVRRHPRLATWHPWRRRRPIARRHPVPEVQIEDQQRGARRVCGCERDTFGEGLLPQPCRRSAMPCGEPPRRPPLPRSVPLVVPLPAFRREDGECFPLHFFHLYMRCIRARNHWDSDPDSITEINANLATNWTLSESSPRAASAATARRIRIVMAGRVGWPRAHRRTERQSTSATLPIFSSSKRCNTAEPPALPSRQGMHLGRGSA